MRSKLEAANAYIRANKHRVTNRPHYHFAAEIGWINDPNGFIHYGGEYHLFYQYNPYSTVWNDMHWGHATTKDFIRWDYKPVALANDRPYDAGGCFSGSAIGKDGKLYLMYTGHVVGDDGQVVQRQCLAVSEDGIHFEKHPANPVIGERELPAGYMLCDFRDPKVWREADGVYYCVLAVRNEKRRGEIVMFRSEDLVRWQFHSSVYRTEEAQNMLLECPDFFHLDGKDVLIFSVMPCDPEYAGQVANHVAYAVGKLDFGTGRFEPEAHGVLDRGPSFYAPQTTAGPGGERLLIGWMQSWRQGKLPDGFEFNGMMTIPRRLRIEGGKLLQQPFLPDGSFAPVRSGEAALDSGRDLVLLESGSGRILLELDRADVEELKGNPLEFRLQEKDGRAIRVEVDAAAGQLSVRNDYESGQHGKLDVRMDDGLRLELFVDLYSLELFVNGGEQVYSATSYATRGAASTVSAARSVRLRKLESRAFRKA